MGVKVNDVIGPYFKTFKGLRQGDSLSPLLFDIVADALAIILDKAKHEGLLKGCFQNITTVRLTCYNMMTILSSSYKMMKKVPKT